MLYAEDIPAFIAILLLILVFGFGIRLYEYFAPPAKYCYICGCPTRSMWLNIGTEFNTRTGVGKMRERECWVCSVNSTQHYFVRTRKIRTTIVNAKC